MEITTKSGFRCSIDLEAVADDYELLKSVAAVERGDRLAVMQVVACLLGDEEARLMEHCRGESGRVSTEAVTEEIGEIFDAIKGQRAAKNS